MPEAIELWLGTLAADWIVRAILTLLLARKGIDEAVLIAAIEVGDDAATIDLINEAATAAKIPVQIDAQRALATPPEPTPAAPDPVVPKPPRPTPAPRPRPEPKAPPAGTLEDPATRINRILDQQESRVGNIFRVAIRELKDEINLKQLADTLEAGRLEEALMTLKTVADKLGNAVDVAFVSSGQSTAQLLNTAGLGRVVFDQTNHGAVAAMQGTKLTLIREFTNEQRRATSTALVTGVEAGANPIEQARAFRDSIGLTERQWKHVASYRRALEAVGTDDDEQVKALNRALRDKRGDKQIRRAIKDGKPLPKERIDWLHQRYIDRYIKYRSQVIARTEALRAVHEGNEEAYRQAIENGDIDADKLERGWVTREDGRERLTHRKLNGQKRKWGEPFTTTNSRGGAVSLRYPGDPDAPVEEIVQCFPGWVDLSTAGAKTVISRHYSGVLVQLIDTGGIDLTVTPNHPVLTKRGWVAAGQIIEGDYLLNCSMGDRLTAAQPNIKDRLPSAQRLAYLAQLSGNIHRPEPAAVNFHGEVPDHQVEIITPPRELRDRWKAFGREAFGQVDLLDTDISEGCLLYKRLLSHRLITPDDVQDGVVGGGRESLALARRHTSHPNFHGLATGSGSEAQILDAGCHHFPTDAEDFRHSFDRCTGIIKPGNAMINGFARFAETRVSSIRRIDHDGPVFNLETDSGLIIANGKVTHNCRCALTTRMRTR